MKFSECKKEQRVRYVRLGAGRHGYEGTIISLDSYNNELYISWDNGSEETLCDSVKFLVPIVKVNPNMSDPEGFAFFAKVPKDCCPCGILRASGRCNFH